MSEIKISRITLFSSGVGYFEHRGAVTGTEEISLPFNIDAVNDALKSLVINDPAGNPTVSYPSKETNDRTLKSLSVNLKGGSLHDMLGGLKGSEIEVFVPDSIKGRILFVERRTENANNADIQKDFLTLQTEQGIKTICIDEISNFIFKDPRIAGDLKRALDLAVKSRDERTRNLAIKLSGESERKVALSYVIPAALWKVSYRLVLSGDKPFLQGWAIVDNSSDIDWENIELALVTGKPVSFIQDLYRVHNLDRPIIPLLTDGIAEAKTYDSGSAKKPLMSVRKDINQSFACAERSADYAMDEEAQYEESGDYYDDEKQSTSATAGLVETASSRQAGDQFEFTIKKPVSLERQQSAMLPLIEGDVKAEKYLVFSKYGKDQNSVCNPAICVELTNNTGMKLPAGPITVYDGKTYAGDALIKFFPEEEKRLISYAEDLSVTCSYTDQTSNQVSFVKILQGFMTLNRKYVYKTVYSIRNAGKETKKIIIEHPFSYGAALITPAEYSEKTHNLYRFSETLPPANDFFNFTVTEERTEYEKLEIADYRYNKLANFISSNGIFHEAVKKALQGASLLNEKIQEAETTLKDLQEKRKKLIEKQERTRKNLEAAGNQSVQGKDYLQRLAKEDAGIDALEEKMNTAESAIEKAKEDYKKYLLELKIE